MMPAYETICRASFDPAPRAYHIPVFQKTAVDYLITDPGGVYVDGTLGGGGHAEEVLGRLGGEGRLIGIDRDAEAIAVAKERLSRFGSRFHAVHDRFGRVDVILADLGLPQIHGLLLDLGVSSHQLDTPVRGFSYLQSGPLDMRMDPFSGMTAAELVNTASEQALADLFYLYGEERWARRIARRIIVRRDKGPLSTTADLADVVRACVPPPGRIKSLARVFQALRIAVNQELDELVSCLVRVYPSLAPGGRIVVIMYHGLEARIVKRFFRGQRPTWTREEDVSRERPYRFRLLTPKGLHPAPEEVMANPRARSAVLRAAEKQG